MKSILATGKVIGHTVTVDTYTGDLFEIDGEAIDGQFAAAEIRHEKDGVYSVILDCAFDTLEEAGRFLEKIGGCSLLFYSEKKMGNCQS